VDASGQVPDGKIFDEWIQNYGFVSRRVAFQMLACGRKTHKMCGDFWVDFEKSGLLDKTK
jgi:hypothetical protein